MNNPLSYVDPTGFMEEILVTACRTEGCITDQRDIQDFVPRFSDDQLRQSLFAAFDRQFAARMRIADALGRARTAAAAGKAVNAADKSLLKALAERWSSPSAGRGGTICNGGCLILQLNSTAGVGKGSGTFGDAALYDGDSQTLYLYNQVGGSYGKSADIVLGLAVMMEIGEVWGFDMVPEDFAGTSVTLNAWAAAEFGVSGTGFTNMSFDYLGVTAGPVYGYGGGAGLGASEATYVGSYYLGP
jgi:hypothetical protein